MIELARLQKSFQAAILDGDASFVSNIRETGRIPATTRISIYADAYRLRLIEVLRDNYPGLPKLVGDDAFDRLARAYIDANPSGFRSVRWFGDSLPAFIDRYADDSNREPLREVALVDWNMAAAFDAADASTAGEADMARFAPEQWGALLFRFHPSVRRLDLHHDAFRFRREGDDATAAALDRSEVPQPWVIWRMGLDVHYRGLTADEAWALDSAQGGDSFAALCGGLTQWHDEQDAAMRAVSFLKRWLMDQLIVSVYLPETDPAPRQPDEAE
jgi:hypothetical protein